MRVQVVVIGRPRDAGLAEAIRGYETRAGRYWPLDVLEVREEPAKGLTSSIVRARESARMLERLAPAAQVVVCDPGGATQDSEAFADWLGGQRDLGRSVSFVIGGAFGISDELRARAFRRLSLAPWTLPHEVARLVLAEQLYRAGTILRGEPYHK